MFKMFKKDPKNEETAILVTKDSFDIFLFPTSHEEQYHLVIENFHVGYNHFLLFVDRKNHALHIYDDLYTIVGGTSAINLISEYLIEKLYELLHLKDYKNAKVLIYFPENHKDSGLVSYGYQSKKDDFDFGLDISEITKHEAYLELAKKNA
ncbi:TPA: hypothetical protein ACTZ1F_005919 [Bacillus cereus]|uniref:Uncharacterized protein n=7 Tax=Bacillus TaxID=1386 RepID=A0A9X6Q716_BACTU|nr:MULTISPECIES: hypothetical protein [Bacillus]AEA19459.1 hypothetical protein CT43_P281117 [Bacillus thuringiensis serovar chinensis CT-43]AGG05162.1 hypothetical protein H175_285p124 [Bacillus thuringiensis serovar thuringiensis str. IS5056]AHZ54839.1 hypothetical protein YBT1520_31706 [Bacillus thuringiensis serovar kurstaki str. YBT-1520]AIE37285.1 hypothetical protein BTK_31746 [Bacillus thuringiensis serovar kurstaki str. HD-1]AIM34572.1 hypothetical protein DF16_pBMB293orf00048 [Bacill